MRRFSVTLALVLLVAASVQGKETSHIRILLHAAYMPDSSSVGVAGWVVAPHITSSPTTWFGVAGLRYAGKAWQIEAMPGAIIDNGTRTGLLDIRAKFPKVFNITPWTNLQAVNFSKGINSTFYGYFELERTIVKNIIAFGLETENTIKPDKKKDDYPSACMPTSHSTSSILFPYSSGTTDQANSGSAASPASDKHAPQVPSARRFFIHRPLVCFAVYYYYHQINSNLMAKQNHHSLPMIILSAIIGLSLIGVIANMVWYQSLELKIQKLQYQIQELSEASK